MCYDHCCDCDGLEEAVPETSKQAPGHIPSIEEVLNLFEGFAARQGKLELSLAVRRGLETSRVYQ
jgi:hypothetical protein